MVKKLMRERLKLMRVRVTTTMMQMRKKKKPRREKKPKKERKRKRGRGSDKRPRHQQSQRGWVRGEPEAAAESWATRVGAWRYPRPGRGLWRYPSTPGGRCLAPGSSRAHVRDRPPYRARRSVRPRPQGSTASLPLCPCARCHQLAPAQQWRRTKRPSARRDSMSTLPQRKRLCRSAPPLLCLRRFPQSRGQ